MRINFDTIYSTAIVDLTQDAVLTMPETDGRYQSAWIITDEHYNPADLAIANALQEQLQLEQKDRGSYVASNSWDMEEILAMRASYQEIQKQEGITSEVMFGKKGKVPLKEHNAGTAAGWGGFTAERAVYPFYRAAGTAGQGVRKPDCLMAAGIDSELPMVIRLTPDTPGI